MVLNIQDKAALQIPQGTQKSAGDKAPQREAINEIMTALASSTWNVSDQAKRLYAPRRNARPSGRTAEDMQTFRNLYPSARVQMG